MIALFMIIANIVIVCHNIRPSPEDIGIIFKQIFQVTVYRESELA